MSWVGVITDAGKAAMEQAIAQGVALNVNAVKTGTGTVAEANMRAATALQSETDTGIIRTKKATSGGVNIRISVEPGESAYTMKEVGVFGVVGSGSTSVMIALYQNTDGIAVPAAESFPDFLYTLNAVWNVANDEDLEVTVDPAAFATMTDTELLTTLSRGRAEGSTVGSGSIAFGNNVAAQGSYSVSIGDTNEATGNHSYAQGLYNLASCYFARATGNGTKAVNRCSSAHGFNTIAMGECSVAEGAGTIILTNYGHASGQYNALELDSQYTFKGVWEPNTSYVVNDVAICPQANSTLPVLKKCITPNSDSEYDASKWDSVAKRADYAEVVGNGLNNNIRQNIRMLDTVGNEYLRGNLYIKCKVDSTDGYRVAGASDHTTIECGGGMVWINRKGMKYLLFSASNDADATGIWYIEVLSNGSYSIIPIIPATKLSVSGSASTLTVDNNSTTYPAKLSSIIITFG